MKNTNIKQIAFTAVMGLFLSACGSSSSSYTDDTTPPPVTEIKVPQCGTTVADVTGKTIEKGLDGAEVRIWHDPDGTRSACMITGEATII